MGDLFCRLLSLATRELSIQTVICCLNITSTGPKLRNVCAPDFCWRCTTERSAVARFPSRDINVRRQLLRHFVIGWIRTRDWPLLAHPSTTAFTPEKSTSGEASAPGAARREDETRQHGGADRLSEGGQGTSLSHAVSFFFFFLLMLTLERHAPHKTDECSEMARRK